MNILKAISQQHENLPNFIGLYGDTSEFNARSIWFVMELCHLGPINPLLKRIEKLHYFNEYEKEKLIAYALNSALKALKYIHQLGIMHRGKFFHIEKKNNYLFFISFFSI